MYRFNRGRPGLIVTDTERSNAFYTYAEPDFATRTALVLQRVGFNETEIRAALKEYWPHLEADFRECEEL